jgi:hypothetical protein
MPVKPLYLVAAAGGGLLIWSGLRGHRWSNVLRDVISSQKVPSAEELAITTEPAAYTSGGTVGTGPITATGPSGPGERAWDVALLASIGAPPTTANIQSLVHWRTHECPWDNQPPDGALYTHNPLNTKQPGFGGVPMSNGVMRYPNAAAGIAATRKVLLNGLYPDIVSALRGGRGLASGYYKGLATWSGGGYSSV